MKTRTWSFLAVLFGLFGAAFLLQGKISQKETEAAPRIPPADRLDLLVGGKAPILQLPPSNPPANPPPSPDQRPSPEKKLFRNFPRPPSPKNPPKRWVQLQKGQTIYGICKEVLGDPRKLEQVLRLNGWTKKEASSLKPGTRVLLPPPE
ncbi:MAG TPA: hypothetical protein ENK02_09155 [Planctomycetes bacterium]|nr:hypothetical protein [Planctomycetota bacterium]